MAKEATEQATAQPKAARKTKGEWKLMDPIADSAAYGSAGTKAEALAIAQGISAEPGVHNYVLAYCEPVTVTVAQAVKVSVKVG